MSKLRVLIWSLDYRSEQTYKSHSFSNSSKHMNTPNNHDFFTENNYMTVGLYACFINVLTQIVRVHSFTISNIKSETV